MFNILEKIFFSDYIYAILSVVILILLTIAIINKDVGRIIGYSVSLLSVIALSIFKEMKLADTNTKNVKKDINDVSDELNDTVEKNTKIISNASSEISIINDEIRKFTAEAKKQADDLQRTLNNDLAEISKSKESMEQKIKDAGFTEI